MDHRTDLWALGGLAFECLTGQVPFKGSNLPTQIMAICSDPIPVPSCVADVLLAGWAAFEIGRSTRPAAATATVTAPASINPAPIVLVDSASAASEAPPAIASTAAPVVAPPPPKATVPRPPPERVAVPPDPPPEPT